MTKYLSAAAVLTVTIFSTMAGPTVAEDAGPAFTEDAVTADANAALKSLYASEPVAKMIGEKAKAILVFPDIVKAGFIVGGQYGDGVLMRDGNIVGHYRSVAASYGLQAGVQSFGYALFLTNDKALAYLDRSDGWQLGVGPSIVIVDKGKARSMTTLTLKDDVYAFIFDQKGLMAGLGIQGSKITKLNK
jgi:lipid-binding SYLF domain-containing protein